MCAASPRYRARGSGRAQNGPALRRGGRRIALRSTWCRSLPGVSAAGRLVPEQLAASGPAQRAALQIQRPVVGRSPAMTDRHCRKSGEPWPRIEARRRSSDRADGRGSNGFNVPCRGIARSDRRRSLRAPSSGLQRGTYCPRSVRPSCRTPSDPASLALPPMAIRGVMPPAPKHRGPATSKGSSFKCRLNHRARVLTDFRLEDMQEAPPVGGDFVWRRGYPRSAVQEAFESPDRRDDPELQLGERLPLLDFSVPVNAISAPMNARICAMSSRFDAIGSRAPAPPSRWPMTSAAPYFLTD